MNVFRALKSAAPFSNSRSIEAAPTSERSAQPLTQDERALRILVVLLFAGLGSILLYATQTSTLYQFFSVTGVAFLISGACTLIGSFLGFLFGIPRTLQQDRSASFSESSDTNHKAASQNEAESTSDENMVPSYGANTNLEQISDWLTKILVGVGLTQLGQIPSAFQNFAAYVSPGLGNFGESSKIFAVGLLIYYGICGFLIGYLWTRLQLAGALRRADLLALGITEKISAVEQKLTETQLQAEKDLRALDLVRRQLNPESNNPNQVLPAQEELNTAMKNASVSVRTQVFYEAQQIRSENWREKKNKPKMALTIPIFRALIYSDSNNVYHRNHGQLGYALKDQLKPDWQEAEAELTKAIEIRGPSQQNGFFMYEYSRAICHINQDPGFKQNRPSDAKVRTAVLNDLQAVLHFIGLRELESDTVGQWIRINQAEAELSPPVSTPD